MNQFKRLLSLILSAVLLLSCASCSFKGNEPEGRDAETEEQEETVAEQEEETSAEKEEAPKEVTEEETEAVIEAVATASNKSALSPEEAIGIYMAYKNLWQFDGDYIPMQGYGYCLLDLDFDGVLELICSENDGSGRLSYNKFFRIDPESKTVKEFYSTNDDDMAGVDYHFMSHESKLFKNKTTGELFYLFPNLDRVSGFEGGKTIVKVSMKNGKLYEDSLFTKYYHPDYDNDDLDTTVYEYSFGEEDLSEAEYKQKTDAFYAENEDLHLEWTCVSFYEPDSENEKELQQQLLDAYRSFSYDGFSR